MMILIALSVPNMIMLKNDVDSGKQISLDELRMMLNGEDFNLTVGSETVEIGENQQIASRSMDEEFEDLEAPPNATMLTLGLNQRIVPRYCDRATMKAENTMNALLLPSF